MGAITEVHLEGWELIAKDDAESIKKGNLDYLVRYEQEKILQPLVFDRLLEFQRASPSKAFRSWLTLLSNRMGRSAIPGGTSFNKYLQDKRPGAAPPFGHNIGVLEQRYNGWVREVAFPEFIKYSQEEDNLKVLRLKLTRYNLLMGNYSGVSSRRVIDRIREGP